MNNSRAVRRVRPVHWFGFVVVVGLFAMALFSGAVAAAFAVTGTIVLLSALYHVVRGSSWLMTLTTWFKGSPLLPGFVIGALFFGIGWNLPNGTGADGVAAELAQPATATPSTPATPTTTPTLSPSASPSPTPSPTPIATVTEADTSPSPSPSVSATASPTPDPDPTSTDESQLHPAAAVLAELPIKGRAPKTGYSRDEFGQRWADTDRNGCDTRNDVLGRDLIDIVHKPGTRNCVVLTGTLNDPFTGTAISFVRGQDTSNAVQIDHVVALSDAWQKGAQQHDLATRTEFANDPLNLLAVDGPMNLQKGDGDAATWLPPNKAFRCEYVATQIAVKKKYTLWVTQAEHDAMLRVLSSCPDQMVTEHEAIPTASATPEPTPAAASATAAAPTPVETTPAGLVAATPPAQPATHRPAPLAEVPAPAADVYYKNCDAARAAGAAPIYAGEPGYRKGLDRDGDGIGCE